MIDEVRKNKEVEIRMLSDVSIRQVIIWQDFIYSSIQCQVETPDIM